MYDTNSVGNRTEGKILAALLQMGKNVLIPFGTGARYDLAYDDGGGRMVRVQCKTAMIRNGCVCFKTRSSGRVAHLRDYRGDVDLFGVYDAANDQVYLVPIELTARGQGSLRIAPTRNGQSAKVLWASDYAIPKSIAVVEVAT